MATTSPEQGPQIDALCPVRKAAGYKTAHIAVINGIQQLRNQAGYVGSDCFVVRIDGVDSHRASLPDMSAPASLGDTTSPGRRN